LLSFGGGKQDSLWKSAITSGWRLLSFGGGEQGGELL